MKLGRNMARTFLDYYKLTGYISTKPSSGLAPKPGHHSARDKRAVSEPGTHSHLQDRYVCWKSTCIPTLITITSHKLATCHRLRLFSLYIGKVSLDYQKSFCASRGVGLAR